MNLLTKDKYRAKIMQHVLHQYEENSSDSIIDDDQTDRPFENVYNVRRQSSQKQERSVLFEKVSRQKPLIIDDDDMTVNRPKKQNIIQALYKEAPNLLNQPKLRTHSHKQPYIYHQKLPMMSVSQDYDHQILKRLKSNNKNKFVPNKQNEPKESNHVNESQSKEKKYRFIAPEKVAQVLRLKQNQIQKDSPQKGQNDLDVSECQDDLKQNSNTLSLVNQTHRSKGSREMMNFLDSAREKLFSNMNSQQMVQFEPIRSNETSPNQQSTGTPESNFDSEQKDIQKFSQQGLNSFKLEIEVSAKKSIQLNLNLESNPEEISKSIILSNKHELSSFTDTQIKKLQELLAKKIQNEIEKQSKILRFKHNQKSQNEHKNSDQGIVQAIPQKHQDETLKIPEQKDKTSTKKAQTHIKNKILQKKQKKALQFSHIYIENIDPPFVKQPQTELLNENILNNRESDNQRDPQLIKLVSFNPKEQKQTFSQESQQFISLDGYLNSPHELITYRPDGSQQASSQDSQLQDASQKLDRQQQVSHFPISASLADFSQFAKNVDPNDIGASKILSKSRSKLLNKRKQQSVNHEEQKLTSSEQDSKNLNQQNSPQSNIQQTPTPDPPQPKPKANLQKQNTGRSINSISSQIISRVGKQNIINSLKEKQLNRKEMILREKQAKELQNLKECSFQPKINNLSKSIDQNKRKKIKIGDLIEKDFSKEKSLKNSIFFRQQNLHQHDEESRQNTNTSNLDNLFAKLQKSRHQSRYEQLYANHKQIEARKQYVRQKSFEEISFRPEINKISKKIIETKRNSLNSSTCQEYYSLANSKANMSRNHSTCKKSQEKRHSVHFGQIGGSETESKTLHNKRKSLNFSRNLQGLQIGQYLYKEAMRMKKKKQSLAQPKPQCFKPLQKSEEMVNRIKEKVLTECFFKLLKASDTDQQEYDFVLRPQFIDLEDKKIVDTHLKFLVPLLDELKQLDVCLTKDEFIQSGLKLISCLPQDQKAQFLGKRPPQNHDQNEKPQHQKHINKLSQELIQKKQYYLQDIYHRGILYKKHIKEKLELDMESKVRKELEKCTFKPKIITNFQSSS